MSQVPQTYVPILSTAISRTTDKREMVASAIQYILLNPGRTSATIEGDLVSFRKMASAAGYDRNLMLTELNKRIPPMFQRMFPNDVVRCNFTAKDYDNNSEDPRFIVTFDIVFIDATTGASDPAILKGLFTVADNSEIQVHYDQV